MSQQTTGRHVDVPDSLAAQVLWAIAWIATQQGAATPRAVKDWLRVQGSVDACTDYLESQGLILPAANNKGLPGFAPTHDALGPILNAERAVLGRDAKILTNLADFASFNRDVSTNAMIAGANEARKTANSDDIRRIDKIVLMKTFREFVLGAEEFGALCLSIRERYRNGMFQVFLNYQPREVTEFYQEVQQSPGVSILTLLNLPSISSLKTQVDEPQIPGDAFEQDLANLRTRVGEIADEYSDRNVRTAMNKAKHGFAVMEDIAPIPGSQPLADNEVAVIVGSEFDPNAPDVGEQWRVICLKTEFTEAYRIKTEVVRRTEVALSRFVSGLVDRGADLTLGTSIVP
jgi:hypothetical protein